VVLGSSLEVIDMLGSAITDDIGELESAELAELNASLPLSLVPWQPEPTSAIPAIAAENAAARCVILRMVSSQIGRACN
jgi:hypothetical protein